MTGQILWDLKITSFLELAFQTAAVLGFLPVLGHLHRHTVLWSSHNLTAIAYLPCVSRPSPTHLKGEEIENVVITVAIEALEEENVPKNSQDYGVSLLNEQTLPPNLIAPVCT